MNEMVLRNCKEAKALLDLSKIYLDKAKQYNKKSHAESNDEVMFWKLQTTSRFWQNKANELINHAMLLNEINDALVIYKKQ